jgi:hypothetical protein
MDRPGIHPISSKTGFAKSFLWAESCVHPEDRVAGPKILPNLWLELISKLSFLNGIILIPA